MPGNTITINGRIEYYLGDSKMPKLIKLLDKHGIKGIEKTKEVKNPK